MGCNCRLAANTYYAFVFLGASSQTLTLVLGVGQVSSLKFEEIKISIIIIFSQFMSDVILPHKGKDGNPKRLARICDIMITTHLLLLLLLYYHNQACLPTYIHVF